MNWRGPKRSTKVQAMGEWLEFPTCPQCGFVDQDWWVARHGSSLGHYIGYLGNGWQYGPPHRYGLDEKKDGDEWVANCSGCGVQYRITMSVDVSFQTVAATETLDEGTDTP
jgi:hypothetical protein